MLKVARIFSYMCGTATRYTSLNESLLSHQRTAVEHYELLWWCFIFLLFECLENRYALMLRHGFRSLLLLLCKKKVWFFSGFSCIVLDHCSSIFCSKSMNCDHTNKLNECYSFLVCFTLYWIRVLCFFSCFLLFYFTTEWKNLTLRNSIQKEQYKNNTKNQKFELI